MLDTTRADRLSPYGFMNLSLPLRRSGSRDRPRDTALTSVDSTTLRDAGRIRARVNDRAVMGVDSRRCARRLVPAFRTRGGWG
jgi:hypothetical protein